MRIKFRERERERERRGGRKKSLCFLLQYINGIKNGNGRSIGTGTIHL